MREQRHFRVDSELSEKIENKVGMHQGSALSRFLFAVGVEFVTELAGGVLSEVLYADDSVFMCETIDGLTNKFRKWKEDGESKGLNVDLGKTKMMVNGSITKDGLCKRNGINCSSIAVAQSFSLALPFK